MSTETVQKRKIAVSKTRGSKADTLKVPSFPQVNLLPSGIVEGRALKRVKYTAAAGVAASFVVVGLLYGAAWVDGRAADAELTTARERTATLSAEQLKYAEVNIVRSAQEAFAKAEHQGMATEVSWSDYVSAVAAVVPEEVTLSALEASVGSMLGKYSNDADPLQGDPLGLVTFGGQASTMPDVAEWVRALDAVPGLAEARIEVVRAADREDAESAFDITGSVTITEDARSMRLFGEKE